VFAGEKTPILLGWNVFTGVIDGKNHMIAVGIAAQPDKGGGFCDFPAGIQGIFQKIAQ